MAAHIPDTFGVVLVAGVSGNPASRLISRFDNWCQRVVRIGCAYALIRGCRPGDRRTGSSIPHVELVGPGYMTRYRLRKLICADREVATEVALGIRSGFASCRNR